MAGICEFSLEEWQACETEYAEQALLVAGRSLMVNPIAKIPRPYGGAFYFVNGKTADKSPHDMEDILIIEI